MLTYLRDPETNEAYTVDLSEEDAARVQSDLEFAQSMLEYCRRNSQEEGYAAEENETEEISSQTISRMTWEYDHTLALIASVESHYEDLMHPNPKMKKKAWENIGNDLVSANINVEITDCKKKWTNLVQSYKKSKDVKNKTGRGPSRFCFFERIDDIIGNKPNNCSPHTIDTVAQPTTIVANDSTQEASCSGSLPYSCSPSVSLLSPTATSPNTTPKSKRKNVTFEYIKIKKAYFEKKEEEYEKRKEERKQKDINKRNQLERKMELQERKLAMQERTLNLLEKWMQLKQNKE